jgi:hypothetical protein
MIFIFNFVQKICKVFQNRNWIYNKQTQKITNFLVQKVTKHCGKKISYFLLFFCSDVNFLLECIEIEGSKETEGGIAKWKDTFMVIQCVKQVQQMGQRYTAIASRKHHEDHAMRFNPCATHWIWWYAAHQEEEKPCI